MKMETQDNRLGVLADGYVNAYQRILAKVGDVGASIAILQEAAKAIRMEKRDNSGNAPGHGLASDKQKRYLKSLGVEVKEPLTKNEASALIDQALEKKDGQGAIPESSPNSEQQW